MNEEPIAEPTPQECVFGALFESTPVTAALVLDDKVAQYFAFAQWLGDQPHAAIHARGEGRGLGLRRRRRVEFRRRDGLAHTVSHKMNEPTLGHNS